MTQIYKRKLYNLSKTQVKNPQPELQVGEQTKQTTVKRQYIFFVRPQVRVQSGLEVSEIL